MKNRTEICSVFQKFFLEHSSIFFSPPTSSPEVLSLPLIFPLPALSFESPATAPRPFHVPTPSLPITHLLWRAPSSTSVLPSTADPLSSIWKGTRSSHNPPPIYTFLSYHRLSSPYSAFIFTLSSVSLPNIVHEALSYPG